MILDLNSNITPKFPTGKYHKIQEGRLCLFPREVDRRADVYDNDPFTYNWRRATQRPGPRCRSLLPYLGTVQSGSF